MKKAIAMKCNQEQFYAIRNKLEGKIEFYSVSIQKFEKYDYLVNCDHGMLSNVNKSGFKHIWSQSPEIHEEWNEKVFLEACGIEVEEPKVNIFTLSEPIGDYVIFNGKKYVPEPKEESFVISKSDILHLYSYYTHPKEELKRMFPSAIEPEKKELVVGKWYKNENGSLFFTLSNEPDYVSGYGFIGGCWRGELEKYYSVKSAEEATQQEVEEALKAEGKLKGYDNTNTLVKSLIFDNRTFNLSKSGYDQTGYRLEKTGEFIYNGVTIMKNGKWAEIIQPKKMTKSEIETELGYLIEIV